MESSKRAAPSVPPPQDDPLGPHYPCLCPCGCAGRYRGTSEVCMVCRVRESCVTLRHAFDTIRGAVRLHRRVYGTDPVNKRNWAYLCGLVLDDRDRLREELTELDTAARELLENARQQIQALTAPSVPPLEALIAKWRVFADGKLVSGDDYYDGQRNGKGKCADELEALLAARPSPIGAIEPADSDLTWRDAALRVGEELASSGPPAYYGMTQVEWRDWALSVLKAKTEDEAEIPRLPADAVRAWFRPSDQTIHIGPLTLTMREVERLLVDLREWVPNPPAVGSVPRDPEPPR